MAYARIDEGFWTDPKIRGLSIEGKMVAAWLFTNPHRHFSGLYYLPIVLIEVEIGLSIGVSENILNLLEEQGFIKYSREFQMVWVVNMLRHQSGGKALSTQQITGIKTHLNTLHGCPLINEFIERYKKLGVVYDGKPIDLSIPLSDTPIDIKSKSQSKSKSKEKTPPSPSRGNGIPEDFEAFWTIYPKKAGKQDALKKWRQLKRRFQLPPQEKIIAAVQKQKTWEQWQKDEGQFIPNPATWLNQGRWDDEPPEGGKPEWMRKLSEN